jgi:hypothetical protein
VCHRYKFYVSGPVNHLHVVLIRQSAHLTTDICPTCKSTRWHVQQCIAAELVMAGLDMMDLDRALCQFYFLQAD